MNEYCIIPVNVVRTGFVALAMSLLLNFVGMAIQGPYKHDNVVGAMTSSGDFYRLPISPEPVALEVVDSDRYGMHDDNDWASVIPVGHGFVRLGEYYAVSMYHQMHCLNSFRKMFNGRNESRATHDSAHALHCLTYLRQMVLCSADVTLEPAFATHNVDGRKTQAAYGTGATHQCRDWVQVRQFVERNYEEFMKDDDKLFAVTEATAID